MGGEVPPALCCHGNASDPRHGHGVLRSLLRLLALGSAALVAAGLVVYARQPSPVAASTPTSLPGRQRSRTMQESRHLAATAGSVRRSPLTKASVLESVGLWQMPQMPKFKHMALSHFSHILERKVLPTINQELPNLIRDAGQDPIPLVNSTQMIELTNLAGLSTILITKLEAIHLDPYKAIVELGAELQGDLTADGEVLVPGYLAKTINSHLSGNNPFTAEDDSERVPFTLRMKGLHIPNAKMQLLSNKLAAVDEVKVEATPVEYDQLHMECKEGLLGAWYSPARLLCTRVINRVLWSRKHNIQQLLSETVRGVLQDVFDEQLAANSPHLDVEPAQAYAVLAATVLILCSCGTCAVLAWRRLRRRTAVAAPRRKAPKEAAKAPLAPKEAAKAPLE